MATSHDGSRDESNEERYVERISLGRAVVAGVVGGLVFGVFIQFALGRMPAIGAMYTLGEPSLSVGWIAHLFHSALFGAVFGLASERQPIRGFVERHVGWAALAGAGFGLLLWSVNIVFVWPVWLNAVSFDPAAMLSVPYLAARPLVGHLVYGLITGGLFAVLVDY